MWLLRLTLHPRYKQIPQLGSSHPIVRVENWIYIFVSISNMFLSFFRIQICDSYSDRSSVIMISTLYSSRYVSPRCLPPLSYQVSGIWFFFNIINKPPLLLYLLGLDKKFSETMVLNWSSSFLEIQRASIPTWTW